MANTSIGGLVSGLDTASIISQLIQIEAQPQTNLKNRVSAEQKVVTALQAINAKFAGIATKAAALSSPSAWKPMAATSSNTSVTATAGSGAAPSTLTLTVGRLATASTLTSDPHALTDKVLSDGSTVVALTQPDGTTVDIDTGDGTLQGLANAINAGSYGASATLVQVSAGSYRLQIGSLTTGAKPLALAPGSTAASTTTLAITDTYAAGQQAQITVGADTITSDTNTFTGLMSGVDVTLQPGATGTATITVARDAKGMSDSVKAMVDAVNSVLSDIDTQTGYNADSKTSGPLAGESLLRDVRDRLLSAVTNGLGGSSGVVGTSYADVGIQVDRNGKLVFDEAKFQAAYAADPNGVAADFVDSTTTPTTTPQGLASTFAAITKTASDPLEGTLTLSIKGHDTEISGMQRDIDDWDVRLALKQQSLQRQYGAMEVALGKLQDQASWLNGQISSLPKIG